MISFIGKKQERLSVKIISLLIGFSFISSLVIPPQPAYTQYLPSGVLNLPAPGTRLFITPSFTPTFIQGITVHPENPLEFDFIVNVGDQKEKEQILQEEVSKSINYFLAALTVPENEIWVNLSPYEKDLTISQNFGDTQMGRDLLAQDYILKQLTASMMYPEEKLGEKFWQGVYRKAQEKYGTANIPITTFAKVWIVPDEAVVYEQGSSAVVIHSHLKVMLEEDYLALQKNLGLSKHGLDRIAKDDAESVNAVTSDAVREFLVSEIEKEVNQGKTFANLRQIYNAIILATWFKENLQRSLLGQVYVDKVKTEGVDTEDKQINQKIYGQYVEAFKKGVFDYIKSDYDSISQKNIRRRYFSGGTDFSKTGGLRVDTRSISPQERQVLAGQQFVSAKINLAEIPEGKEVKDVEKAIQMPEKAIQLPVEPGEKVITLPKVGAPTAVSMAAIESQYRKPIIGGNLKREFTKEDIERLLLEIARELKANNIDNSKADVFIAPQELHLERFAAVLEILEELGEAKGGIPKGLIKLGAQNVSHRNEMGAFTGQHATAQQLKDYGVQYVIVGHSEARRGSTKDDPHVRYRETNEVVNAKVRSLVKAGLTPVIAFGETNEERQAGKKFEVVRSQVFDSIAGLNKEELLKIVLAYEPVWAIGTGQPAEQEKVNTMLKFIRKKIEEKFGAEVSAQLRIIYGGSMKPANVASFVKEPNIDGGLIGGAAKKGEDFVPIIREFSKSTTLPSTALIGPVLFNAVAAEEARTGKEVVVMATNIRSPLSLDGIMQAAKESDSVVVFQQAISEFAYTWPHGYSTENTYRFAEEIQRAAQRNSFFNYVLKADHVTFNISDKELMKAFLADKSAQREIIALLDTILSAKSNNEREAIFNKALNNDAFMSDKKIDSALKALKKAIEHVKSAVGAGFTVYALDASFMPMPINARATAFMAGFIPKNASIEAEVGEIGGTRNSTIADALELLTGIRYKEVIKEDPQNKEVTYSELVKDAQGNPIEEYKGKGLFDYGVKPERIAINNGTAHGNNYDKQGNLIETKMNLKATMAIAEALAPYGIKIVQHGVTGTPLKNLPALRAAGITEAHVGTQWQNIFWDELNVIAQTNPKIRDLVNRMLNTLIERYGKKYEITPGKIAATLRFVLKGIPAEEKKFEKMIGTELKNILGDYQEEFDVLPADVKARIAAATKKSALEHFKAVGTVGMGQAVAKQALRTKRDNYPLQVTSRAAAELTSMGLRGAYQKVLDIINLTKNPQQQSRELISFFRQLSETSGQHQKITAILPLVTSRDSSQALTKEELKKINTAIKDAADGVAKQIFERTAKEQGIILMVRVSEGFGRDEVAESLKANEVVIPDEIRGEIKEIKAAIDAGEEFYSSKTTAKLYPIADVIVDVIEGTNQFVTNSGNKTLKEIPAHEAGATSVVVLSYGRQGGIRALGNAPDGYVGQFIANLGKHAEEFNREKVLLEENGRPVFYSLKDPELYAKYPAMIIKYLEFLAKTRGQKLSELEEEIVIMDRPREGAFLSELRKLQLSIPGLKIVGQDQKGITDGTVAHGLKATMDKETYEAITANPYGLHKTLITIGGSAEGFMNLAVVGELKSTGAVGALRIYSAKMNNNAQGQVMNDQSQRYVFSDDEKKEIRELRTSYGDAEDILQGKKLFTEQDVKGDVSGAFSFISTNGVFHQEGNRKNSETDSVSHVLKIIKVSGAPKSEIISDGVNLEQFKAEPTAVAEALDEPNAVELGKIISEAIKSEETRSLSLTGRTLYDALKADSAGKRAVTMCTNIRTPLSLDGIMQAAKESGSIAIFQQAITEFGYTWPQGYKPENTYQFAEEVKTAAQRNKFSDYVLKADHITVKIDDAKATKDFLADQSAQREVETLLETVLAKKTNAERQEVFNQAFNNQAFMSNVNVANAMKAVKRAVEHVKSAVGAGFTVYALDASFMPMPINARATAFMAGFISGNASIEAEVGEIGGSKNSTIADALELLTGVRYKEIIKEEPVPNDPKKTIQYSELVKDAQGKPIEEYKGKGLLSYGVKPDRMAVNNGTAHGNAFDKEGNPVQTQMNLKATVVIAEALAPYGIKIVQHGVTGTPLANIPALRDIGIASAHVGTQWQNIVWETLNTIAQKDNKIQDLVNRMIDTLVEKYGKKYGISSRELSLPEKVLKGAEHQKKLKQLIDTELKNILGKYKEELDNLPQAVKDQITAATKKSALEHYKAFGTAGTAQIVKDYIRDNPVVMVRTDTFTAAFGPTRESVMATSLASSTVAEHAEGIVNEIKKLRSDLDVRLIRVRGKPNEIHIVGAHGPAYLLGRVLPNDLSQRQVNKDENLKGRDIIVVYSFAGSVETTWVIEAASTTHNASSAVTSMEDLKVRIETTLGKPVKVLESRSVSDLKELNIQTSLAETPQVLRAIFPDIVDTSAGSGDMVYSTEKEGLAIRRPRNLPLGAWVDMARYYRERSEALGILTISRAEQRSEYWLVEAKKTAASSSTTAVAPKNTGGINLNPALINLQIKRDPNGVPLPLYQQPISDIKIRGFLPVIISIKPFDFSGFLEVDNSSFELSRSK